MRISGHSTDNEVVNSLMEILSKEQETKTASRPVSGMDIFSSQTDNDLRTVQIEQLRDIAAELDFQAKQSSVTYTEEEFIKFASENRQLRGKPLERAARKFCSALRHAQAPPQGTTKRTTEYLKSLGSHGIVPAGYEPGAGPNDSATGRPLGSDRNPNTMWEPDAIVRTAQTPRNDEKTATEKKQAVEQRESHTQKAAMDRLAEAAQWAMSKGLRKTAGAPSTEDAHNPKISKTHMSVFSKDRDFEDIGKEDTGKQIREAADQRSHKKEASKAEWNDVKPPENTRSAIDKLFEGWLNK